MSEKKEIYLDYHATTPVLPEVLEAMSPYFCNHFGNANSTHQWGWKADMAVSKSTKQVADLIGAKPSQVYFTSGATESLHWAIVGWTKKNKNSKILTSTTEHKATYGACDWAKELGAKVQLIDVDNFGIIKMDLIRHELQEEVPTLLTLIYGNNEIGTLNPIVEICELKKEFPHLAIHVDAAQCVGKIPVHFSELDMDFLSFSGHKLYAPKGVGALIIKDKSTLAPLFSGGGQQRGMRAGTIDTPSIVGIGEACQWAQQNMAIEARRLKEMKDKLIEKLLATNMVKLNGHPEQRLPNNMSLTFKNITMDKLLLKLPKVGFSSSSACTSGNTSISHVLKAIGLSDQQARQTLRFGIGHGTTSEELEYITDQLIAAINEAKDFHSDNK